MIVTDTADSRSVLRALWGQYPYYVPSVMLALFGWVLLLPGDTFAAASTFAGMAAVASEGTWGRVLLGAGLLHVLTTAFSTRRVALACLAVVLFAHAYIALSLWQNSTAPTTGVAAYGVYVTLALWSFSHWDVKWRRT